MEGVPPELAAICVKAMSINPEARYASARDLADDLSAWFEGRVVQAHETGKLAQLRKWRERNRALLVCTTASLLVEDRQKVKRAAHTNGQKKGWKDLNR